MNTRLYPLDIALEMAKDVELEVTYEYEDLVFVKHNAFLFRFNHEDASKIHLHFNEECDKEAIHQLKIALGISAKERGINLIHDVKYALIEDADSNNFKIKFMDA